MSRYTYERLSAQDNAFLLWETPSGFMHISATQIYRAGPLATEEGGIDIDAIKRATAAVLHRIPRYRQKLQWIPLENHAVWVDDPHFDLDYHIRHTSLPRPGTDTQLKQLAARVMAQQLDRTKPLWETWVVEGLRGDRFALINKLHHCMVDGSSGVGIADILMTTRPETEVPDPPTFVPRPSPTARQLWLDAALRRLTLPLDALRGARRLRWEAEHLSADVANRLRALRELVGFSVKPPSRTPINRSVGPHRKVDWVTMELADVKAVRKAFGCTVNDVVLTTVTGAIRDFLLRRQMRPERVDFRASAPVSMRRGEDRGQLGNQVSSWIVTLPVGELDPRRQLDAIHENTQALKDSRQALGVETINTIAEWTTSSLLSLGAQAGSAACNTIVTNVPGPQFPLYLLGAELESIFPQVPLMPNMGLGIALISYNGRVFWGFNADPAMLPDLAEFAEGVRTAFGRVAEAAGVPLSGWAAAAPHGDAAASGS